MIMGKLLIRLIAKWMFRTWMVDFDSTVYSNDECQRQWKDDYFDGFQADLYQFNKAFFCHDRRGH